MSAPEFFFHFYKRPASWAITFSITSSSLHIQLLPFSFAFFWRDVW